MNWRNGSLASGLFSTLAQSVPDQLRIKFTYTLDQADIHPGDSRGKEIMPFSTKLNGKV